MPPSASVNSVLVPSVTTSESVFGIAMAGDAAPKARFAFTVRSSCTITRSAESRMMSLVAPVEETVMAPVAVRLPMLVRLPEASMRTVPAVESEVTALTVPPSSAPLVSQVPDPVMPVTPVMAPAPEMSTVGESRRSVYPPPPVFVMRIASPIARSASALSIRRAASRPFVFALLAWPIAMPRVVPAVALGVPVSESMLTVPPKSEVTPTFSVPARVKSASVLKVAAAFMVSPSAVSAPSSVKLPEESRELAEEKNCTAPVAPAPWMVSAVAPVAVMLGAASPSTRSPEVSTGISSPSALWAGVNPPTVRALMA